MEKMIYFLVSVFEPQIERAAFDGSEFVKANNSGLNIDAEFWIGRFYKWRL